MKRFIVLIAVMSLLIGCQTSTDQPTAQPMAEQATDGIFIHLKSGPDQPHNVLMALQLAVMMADTLDVIVYADIDGIYALLEDAPDVELSHFPSSHTQINALLDKGVPVMACPGCLKTAEKTAEDLMEGIQVADRAQFFAFTEGRILTIDY